MISLNVDVAHEANSTAAEPSPAHGSDDDDDSNDYGDKYVEDEDSRADMQVQGSDTAVPATESKAGLAKSFAGHILSLKSNLSRL